MLNKFLQIPLALGVFLFMVGCKATNLPQEQTQAVDSTSVNKTMEREVVYRDTTIFVQIPVERYKEFAKDTSRLETAMVISKAWIVDGGIMHLLESKNIPIPIMLPKAIKSETTKTVEIIKIKQSLTIRTTINKLTRWQTFCVGVVKYELCLLALCIILMFIFKNGFNNGLTRIKTLIIRNKKP